MGWDKGEWCMGMKGVEMNLSFSYLLIIFNSTPIFVSSPNGYHSMLRYGMMEIYIYIYIYVCVCVCVCVWSPGG